MKNFGYCFVMGALLGLLLSILNVEFSSMTYWLILIPSSILTSIIANYGESTN